jgi:hypothetical protein
MVHQLDLQLGLLIQLHVLEVLLLVADHRHLHLLHLLLPPQHPLPLLQLLLLRLLLPPLMEQLRLLLVLSQDLAKVEFSRENPTVLHPLLNQLGLILSQFFRNVKIV